MVQRGIRNVKKRPRAESPTSADEFEKSPVVRKPKKKVSRRDNKKHDNSDKLVDKVTTPQVNGHHKWIENHDEAIENVVSSLFDKKKMISCSHGTNPVAAASRNLLHFMHQLQMGQRTGLKLRQSTSQTVASQLSELQLFRTASPFERRCTAVEWHPTNPGMVAVGSKGGEILVWDINTVNKDILLPGTGPAGSIQALKYDPRDYTKLITSSIDGTVSIHNLKTSQKEVFMDTMNSHDDWYCSLDIHQPTNVATVGDNHGNITLKSLEGSVIFTGRLHRQKVTHIEYSRREEWMFATASVDQTVQIWDMRHLKGRDSSLAVLKHDKPVNSVYFSLSTGTKLLSTDQHSQLRVYNLPTFELSHTIAHPHRHFRHITPHKAHWHPLCDIIVVGRYPDEKFPGYTAGELRTVDMFDADTGNMICQLHDPQAKGIISLNKFSHDGEYLASTMGLNVLIWSPRYDVDEKHRKLMSAMADSGIGPPRNNNSNRRSRPPSKQTKNTKQKKAEQKTAQEKLKAKVTKGKR